MRVLSKNGEEQGRHRVMLVDLVGKKVPDPQQKVPLRVLTSVELFCEV